jgi:hypothetical protein
MIQQKSSHPIKQLHNKKTVIQSNSDPIKKRSSNQRMIQQKSSHPIKQSPNQTVIQ